MRSLFIPTHRRRRRPKRAQPGLPVKGREHQRGAAALIMVTVLVLVLTAIATDLQNSANVSLQLSANARDRLQAQFHASSAVDLELFLLRFEGGLPETFRKFLPISLSTLSTFFVSSDTMKGLFDGKKDPFDGVVDIEEDRPFGKFEGSFFIESVTNENEKISLNAIEASAGAQCANPIHHLLAAMISEEKYDPLFERLGDSRDPTRNRLELISNITDYVDGNSFVDNVCTFTGDRSQGTTEDARYDNLPYNAQYEPKNAKLLSVEELRMVPMVNDAIMALFADRLTVWSKNNIIALTDADHRTIELVIRMLLPGPPQPQDTEKIAEFMKERSLLMALTGGNGKLTEGMFTTLLQKVGLRYDQQRFNLLKGKAFSFDAKVAPVYKIVAVGRVGDTTSTMTVLWGSHGNSQNGDVLYWRED